MTLLQLFSYAMVLLPAMLLKIDKECINIIFNISMNIIFHTCTASDRRAYAAASRAPSNATECPQQSLPCVPHSNGEISAGGS